MIWLWAIQHARRIPSDSDRHRLLIRGAGELLVNWNTCRKLIVGNHGNRCRIYSCQNTLSQGSGKIGSAMVFFKLRNATTAEVCEIFDYSGIK